MPAVTGTDDCRCLRTVKITVNIDNSLFKNAILNHFAFTIGRVQLTCKSLGLPGIITQHQSQREICTGQTTGGINTRSDHKPKMIAINLGAHARGPNQSLDSESGHPVDFSKTMTHKNTVFTDQRHNIRNRTQSHQIKIFLQINIFDRGFFQTAPLFQQSLTQLESYADSGQSINTIVTV